MGKIKYIVEVEEKSAQEHELNKFYDCYLLSETCEGVVKNVDRIQFLCSSLSDFNLVNNNELKEIYLKILSEISGCSLNITSEFKQM